jgi:hypothetical protein
MQKKLVRLSQAPIRLHNEVVKIVKCGLKDLIVSF